jgi:hypothetical protein
MRPARIDRQSRSRIVESLVQARRYITAGTRKQPVGDFMQFHIVAVS